MQPSDGGEYWCTTVDDLAVSRTAVEAGGSTLVRLRLTNERDHPVVARVVEELPERATNAVPMTTTGNEIDNWRRVGDSIVHEFAIPVGQKRTSAYLIRSEDEPPLPLDPPTVDAIEPVEDATRVDVGTVLEPIDEPADSPAERVTNGLGGAREPSRERSTPTAPSAVALADEKTSESGEDRAMAPLVSVERSSTEDETATDSAEQQWSTVETTADDGTESLVEDLIEALEEDASSEQRRVLRSKLGVSESERARLAHVQSRVDDLAAYIDALEEFIDAHGADVVDDMRDAIDETASGVATLEEDVGAMEDEFDRHRDETAASLEAIESEMTAIWSGLSDRLEALESELNATRSTLAALEEDVESDRQARAREVRRFDQSMSEMEETIERLEAGVDENDAFRRRFTAAFTSGSDALQGEFSSDEHDEGDAAATDEDAD